MKNKTPALVPNGTYHVYNRAIGRDLLFTGDPDYMLFLERYSRYIGPVADTLAYCLMPNHFHFLIRIKGEGKLRYFFRDRKKDLEGVVSQQFSNMFNSYAKTFNLQENRKGSLFMHTFKRRRIEDHRYLRKAIHYIHLNPVEGELTDDPKNWKYSSYAALLSKKETRLDRDHVLSLFGGRENFAFCHLYLPG